MYCIGPHGAAQMTRSAYFMGCTIYFPVKWVLKLYDMFLNGFLAKSWRFNPFLEDLGPFLRLHLGEKSGDGYQL
jgi:hypothetical protein